MSKSRVWPEEAYGPSREEAERRIHASDKARHEFHSKYFKIDFLELSNYHLALNTGRLSDVQAAEVIVTAARVRRMPADTR